MMKKIALGLGLGMVAIAGSAILIGHITHKRLDDATHKIAEQSSFLRVANIERTKRVFSSSRRTTLEFGCAGATGAPPFSIVWKEDILHGPLPGWKAFGASIITGEIVLPADKQQVVGPLFGGQAPFLMRTAVGFDGSLKQSFSSPAGRMIPPKGSELIWR